MGRALCATFQPRTPLLELAVRVSSRISASYSRPLLSAKGLQSRPIVVWVLLSSWGAARAGGWAALVTAVRGSLALLRPLCTALHCFVYVGQLQCCAEALCSLLCLVECLALSSGVCFVRQVLQRCES